MICFCAVIGKGASNEKEAERPSPKVRCQRDPEVYGDALLQRIPNRVRLEEPRVDRHHDGIALTKADGIIYYEGAGGQRVSDLVQSGTMAPRPEASTNYAVKTIYDRRSLTVIDVDSSQLALRQIHEWGT